MAPVCDPHWDYEMAMFDEGAATVGGVDEVGRGAWAGPVSVGVTVVDRATIFALPSGVRDSKMLSPLARERLFDPLRAAVTAYSIGHATSDECDLLGMTAALGLATTRALAGLAVQPDRLILDGTHNYTGLPGVLTVARADQVAISVAAASVLAKVTRDRLMVEQAGLFPEFCFHANKGYPSPDHRRALSMHGLTTIHRRSWSFANDYGA